MAWTSCDLIAWLIALRLELISSPTMIMLPPSPLAVRGVIH
jgi:hypothetical protein